MRTAVTALAVDGGMAPSGTMLAIRGASDDLTEPCPAGAADAIDARAAGSAAPPPPAPMPPTPRLAAREILVHIGLGHGFLYRPLPERVDPVVALRNAPTR